MADFSQTLYQFLHFYAFLSRTTARARRLLVGFLPVFCLFPSTSFISVSLYHFDHIQSFPWPGSTWTPTLILVVKCPGFGVESAGCITQQVRSLSHLVCLPFPSDFLLPLSLWKDGLFFSLPIIKCFLRPPDCSLET